MRKECAVMGENVGNSLVFEIFLEGLERLGI